MKPAQILERMEVDSESLFYHEHAARYEFARLHIQPGLVLDLATGLGDGAQQLCWNPALQVIGADIYLQGLSKARKEYTDRRINFVGANGLCLPFKEGCFHSVVTLETIEHVLDDAVFMREICRVLRPDGVCILSTPHRHKLVQRAPTSHYVREYSENSLRMLLQNYFAKVTFFYQGFSDNFYAQMRHYATAIQTKKGQLNPALRFAIDHLYRPLKWLVPLRVSNYFIRHWFNLSNPQPKLMDITISSEPLQVVNVFIAVCQQPHEWRDPALNIRPAPARTK